MKSPSRRRILRREKKGPPRGEQSPQSDGIAERVRFWEEQDRINEVLISKVIRQHELLTDHIKEHDNLPDLFSQHLKAALELQSRQVEAELKKSVDRLHEAQRRRVRQAVDRIARRAKLPTRFAAAGAFVVSLMALAVSLWM